MSRKLVSLIVLGLVLLLAGPAGAQEPELQHSDPYWHVSYWNNMTMYGIPVVEGTDANLDFAWGAGSPPLITGARTTSTTCGWVVRPCSRGTMLKSTSTGAMARLCLGCLRIASR